MSCYPMLAQKEKQDEESPVSAQEEYNNMPLLVPRYHNYVAPDADPEEVDDKLKECLLYYPDMLNAFPLAFPDIATSQQADPVNQALLLKDRYELQEFHGTQLTCRHDEDDQWRIVLPEALIDPAISWYHYALGHVRTARLCQTLRTHCWVPNLQAGVKQVVLTCDSCQRNKNPGPGQGHLPPRQDIGLPWEEVAVDLVGPWKIEVPENIGRALFFSTRSSRGWSIQVIAVIRITSSLF
jgi:hypothetical protein